MCALWAPSRRDTEMSRLAALWMIESPENPAKVNRSHSLKNNRLLRTEGLTAEKIVALSQLNRALGRNFTRCEIQNEEANATVCVSGHLFRDGHF